MTNEAEMLALADCIESPPATKKFSPTEIAMITQALRAAARPSPDAGLLEREAVLLLSRAFNSGFIEGTKEHTSSKGGANWSEKGAGFKADLVALLQRPAVAVEVGVHHINGPFASPIQMPECRYQEDTPGSFSTSLQTMKPATPSPSGRDPATVEACAKVAEDEAKRWGYHVGSSARNAAAMIRALATPADRQQVKP